MAVVLIAAAAKSPSLGQTAAVGYFVVAPIIHAANGSVGRAFGSLGLRLGLPLGGALGGWILGRCAANNSEYTGDSCTGSVALGLVGGFVGAIAVDAAVLAEKEVPVEDSPLPRASPFVSADQHSGTVGLRGMW
jgi:hypothetical protein